jgi:hypothetical protein
MRLKQRRNNTSINNRGKASIKTRKSSKTPFKLLSCGTLKNHSKKYTCYDNNMILKIKDLWNKRHPDDTITSTSQNSIWKSLKHKMSGLCDNEICWLKKTFTDNDIIEDVTSHTFSPIAPETWKTNRNTWLSNFDISSVMKQYEKKYSNFCFIGPTPMDFDKIEHENVCVWDDLCKFDIKDMVDKKKDKIGIIFNTDYNSGTGKHWTSMFICLKNRLIYYFNSSGAKATKEVMKLVERIMSQGKSLGIDFKFDQNYPKQHQYSGSECGMYSIYFIVNMLTGKLNPETLKKTRITDSKMIKYRDIFFNII